jgi:protein xylosyltransferase
VVFNFRFIISCPVPRLTPSLMVLRSQVAPAVTIITTYPSFPPSSRVEVSSAVASTTLVATQGPTTASPTPIPPSTLSSPPPTDSTKPCTVHGAEAVFALERARTPQCSKLISATACADEDGSLYPELHPNPLPSCSGPLLKDGNKMLARPLHGGGGAVATAAAAAPLRIAYMIVCHGRSLRQVKRLIRLLYDPRHFIMIHVDSRSAYMHRHLVTLVDQLGPNVWLTPWRLATIWGGLNLYQMYLRAIRELLEHPWDYFINLSGADLPIVPLSNLTAFLQRFRPHRANFLKSHSNQKSFVRKQGLNKTWVLCDNHMWRTGPRSFPPRGMRVEGGSDWCVNQPCMPS